jgi:hypothetical protein
MGLQFSLTLRGSPTVWWAHKEFVFYCTIRFFDAFNCLFAQFKLFLADYNGTQYVRLLAGFDPIFVLTEYYEMYDFSERFH